MRGLGREEKSIRKGRREEEERRREERKRRRERRKEDRWERNRRGEYSIVYNITVYVYV